MQTIKKLFVLALALNTICAYADSGASTAQDYLDECSAVIKYYGKSADSINAGESWKLTGCLGLIDGLRVAEFLLKEAGSSEGFCAPDGMTNEQLAVMAVRGLMDNPKLLDKRGNVAVFQVLKASFPCEGTRI